MDFEPFGRKALQELDEKDLEILREVGEGWYVEYKRELSKADAIGKSVAAFANTYGGWVFYGIEEKSRDEQVAGSFPGIPDNEVNAALSRIRQAVAQGVNPSTHYDVHVIRASGSGAIQSGRAVIVLRVQKSFNTPHIHRSGLIYRRVGDGSEPVPETDRGRLGELFKRRNRLEKHYSRILRDQVSLPTNQKNAPFIRLLVVSDLWKEKGLWFSGSIDRIREIMGDKVGEIATWPFDTVHNSHFGFVARQLDGNHPGAISSTWELFRDLTSDIIVPLRYANLSKIDDGHSFLDGYEQQKRFSNILRADGHTEFKVIDINSLFAVLMGLSNIQAKLMAELGCDGIFWFKAQIQNANGFVPFLDCQSVLEYFEKHHAPVVLRKAIAVYPGNGLTSFAEAWESRDDQNESGTSLSPVVLGALAMFTHIVCALGLPEWMQVDSSGGADYYSQIIAASQRFQDAQTKRNNAIKKT